jgi:glycosyltransferase involved in cell wall biosynthesis
LQCTQGHIQSLRERAFSFARPRNLHRPHCRQGNAALQPPCTNGEMNPVQLVDSILYLSCVPPLPDGIGIEKRAWTHLQALSAEQPTDLVVVLTDAQLAQRPRLDAARALCRSLHVLRLQATPRGTRHGSGLLSLVSQLLHFGEDALAPTDTEAQRLFKHLGCSHFKRVFCFRLRCYHLWQRLVSRQRVMTDRLYVDFDDIESVAQRRELAIQGSALGRVGRLCARLEVTETARLENEALRHSEVVVCSEEDRQRLLQRVPAAKVHVVPNAFPLLDRLAPRAASQTLELLFIGTLSYAPNIDAARYFCAEVLPRIEQGWSGPVRLAIVGRRPSPSVQALHAPPRVDVVGEVSSVTPAYADCDLVVAPIRHGGGTRIKILEALSLGRPVVTTTLGCEGLGLRDGVDALIADTPDTIAEACLRLARDRQLAAQVVEQGRSTLDQRFRSERVQMWLRDRLFKSAPPQLDGQ